MVFLRTTKRETTSSRCYYTSPHGIKVPAMGKRTWSSSMGSSAIWESNWVSQPAQSICQMLCTPVWWPFDIYTLCVIFSYTLACYIFKNSLIQSWKHDFHKAVSWPYRTATMYVEGMTSLLSHKHTQTQNSTSVVSRAKSTHNPMWKTNRNLRYRMRRGNRWQWSPHPAANHPQVLIRPSPGSQRIQQSPCLLPCSNWPC